MGLQCKMNAHQDHGGDLCKNHSARSEKEFCRVCPSNLNKKELENVYFTLLENNLDLKTTINNQREKIKILSTKVQRLTALQKTYLGKEPKECCGSKAFINEQKECISELRRSNHSLSERVRQLNMRLCSAKQFLKRSPFQSTSRCNRCSNKNVSTSALLTKRSETNLRNTAASSQCLVKDVLSSRTIDNNILSHDKGVQYDCCDDNKYRDCIEELKKKNNYLEAELIKMKDNHAAVSSQLERDACDLRVENVRARSDRALAEERAEQLRAQLADVAATLAKTDLRCDELATEVAMERRKVTELETRLRAADVSGRVASAIETHLNNIEALAVQSSYKPKAAARTKFPRNAQVDEAFKSPDDSGYIEVNKSQVDIEGTKASTYVNQVLLEKIADLQNQINNLKAYKNDYNKPNDGLKITKDMSADNDETLTMLPDKHQIDENIISESSESVITEKNVNNVVAQESGKNSDDVFKMKLSNPVSKVTGEHGVNLVKDQGIKSNEGDKSKENLNFKISKALYHDNTVGDRRKLSLQNSRDILKEKNLIKTGSFDERSISNVHNVKENIVKRFDVRDAVAKSANKKPTSRDTVANMGRLNQPVQNIQYTNEEKATESHKESRDEIESRDNNSINNTKDEPRKDSDSSKGTYTIKKYENPLKLKPGATNKSPSRTKENKNSYILAADVKKVLNSATVINKTSNRQTFIANELNPHKARREVSPASTECEISSMSDLPSERDERADWSRSPGEERPLTTSESRLSTATTDYGSLSEGELPYLRESTILSDGEKRLPNRTRKSHSVPQMEATLAAVQQELTRCTQLLRSRAHRSLDYPQAT